MKSILLILTLLLSFSTIAQKTGVISGKVLDIEMNNEPLIFANVQLKGSSQTTQTNFHGNFEFTHLEEGEYTLLVSYAGYDKFEQKVIVGKGPAKKIICSLNTKKLLVNSISVAQIDQPQTTNWSTGVK